MWAWVNNLPWFTAIPVAGFAMSSIIIGSIKLVGSEAFGNMAVFIYMASFWFLSLAGLIFTAYVHRKMSMGSQGLNKLTFEVVWMLVEVTVYHTVLAVISGVNHWHHDQDNPDSFWGLTIAVSLQCLFLAGKAAIMALGINYKSVTYTRIGDSEEGLPSSALKGGRKPSKRGGRGGDQV